jgi:hypothetical protein
MYTNIQQAISAVESAYPSLFTKEDVVKLLNDIDLESSAAPSASEFTVDDLVEAVSEVISGFDTEDIVSYEDIELSIDHNHRIEIDNINVDLNDLHDEVSIAIYDFFKKNAKKRK